MLMCDNVVAITCLPGQEVSGECVPLHGSTRRQLSCGREDYEGDCFAGTDGQCSAAGQYKLIVS